MDKVNEQPEYVAPMIVDYGDIFEITAAISTHGYADVPQNSGPYGNDQPQDQPSLPL
jgi:hypothetical protein